MMCYIHPVTLILRSENMPHFGNYAITKKIGEEAMLVSSDETEKYRPKINSELVFAINSATDSEPDVLPLDPTKITNPEHVDSMDIFADYMAGEFRDELQKSKPKIIARSGAVKHFIMEDFASIIFCKQINETEADTPQSKFIHMFFKLENGQKRLKIRKTTNGATVGLVIWKRGNVFYMDTEDVDVPKTDENYAATKFGILAHDLLITRGDEKLSPDQIDSRTRDLKKFRAADPKNPTPEDKLFDARGEFYYEVTKHEYDNFELFVSKEIDIYDGDTQSELKTSSQTTRDNIEEKTLSKLWFPYVLSGTKKMIYGLSEENDGILGLTKLLHWDDVGVLDKNGKLPEVKFRIKNELEWLVENWDAITRNTNVYTKIPSATDIDWSTVNVVQGHVSYDAGIALADGINRFWPGKHWNMSATVVILADGKKEFAEIIRNRNFSFFFTDVKYIVLTPRPGKIVGTIAGFNTADSNVTVIKCNITSVASIQIAFPFGNKISKMSGVSLPHILQLTKSIFWDKGAFMVDESNWYVARSAPSFLMIVENLVEFKNLMEKCRHVTKIRIKAAHVVIGEDGKKDEIYSEWKNSHRINLVDKPVVHYCADFNLITDFIKSELPDLGKHMSSAPSSDVHVVYVVEQGVLLPDHFAISNADIRSIHWLKKQNELSDTIDKLIVVGSQAYIDGVNRKLAEKGFKIVCESFVV